MQLYFLKPDTGAKVTYLYQWDTNVNAEFNLTESDTAIEAVFSTIGMKEGIRKKCTYSDGKWIVNVPDKVLIYGTNVSAYITYVNTESRRTVEECIITVRKSAKPEGYVSKDEPLYVSAEELERLLTDKASVVNKAISDAEEIIEATNASIKSAETNKENLDNAIKEAETATTNAIESANKADQAAEKGAEVVKAAEDAVSAKEIAEKKAKEAVDAAEIAVSAKKSIIDEEAARQQAETLRVNAENERQQNEVSRQQTEQNRVEAENSRTIAETAREDAEAVRQQSTSEALKNAQEAVKIANQINEASYILDADTGTKYAYAIYAAAGKPHMSLTKITE